MARVTSDSLGLEEHATEDGHELHILLVDDSQFQRLLLGHLLRKLGHSVTIASDGFEALSAVQLDRCYDVILMDCQMPLMDGLVATRFIREIERVTGQQIAIIGMSANASAEECFMAGMDDFLRKPLSNVILKTVLSRWIRQKKGRTDWRCRNIN